MIDIDKLEALAKAAQDNSENIGEQDWYEADEISSLMHGLIAKADAGLRAGCTPPVILALIAEVRALREDKARLDSGCIVTHERDEFGEEYRCERRGNDLRAMIDAARREKA